VYKNAFTERTCGQGIALLAIGDGIGLAHCFCPYAADLFHKHVDNWMIRSGASARLAVRYCRGYSEKVGSLGDSPVPCPVKTGEAASLGSGQVNETKSEKGTLVILPVATFLVMLDRRNKSNK
jgi:hypothetical protein